MRERRRLAEALNRAARRSACALLLLAALPLATMAAPFDLAALCGLLGKVGSGDATFTETRRVEQLDRTLESSGTLSFRAPDNFVRETLRPRHDKLVVNGNQLTMTLGERSLTVQLDAQPEAAVIVEAIRGTLTGNRAALERLFETSVAGNAERWSLDLVPRDLRLRGQVASVRVSGQQSTVREMQVLLADGDRSTMRIEPAAAARAGS